MKVIAGLGNPGPEYEDTPHNVGFDVVALLAERLAVAWRTSTRFQARLARVDRGSEAWLLMQPQTFMNLSGTSVVPVLRYHGGGPGIWWWCWTMRTCRWAGCASARMAAAAAIADWPR